MYYCHAVAEVHSGKDKSCASSFEYLRNLIKTEFAPYSVKNIDGWCNIDDLKGLDTFRFDGSEKRITLATIEQIRWKIDGWEGRVGHELPDDLDLHITGIRLTGIRQNLGRFMFLSLPVYDYVLRVQSAAQPGADIVVKFTRIDDGTKPYSADLKINQTTISVLDDNALNFSGQLRNVNLEALSGSGMGLAAVVIDHAELRESLNKALISVL